MQVRRSGANLDVQVETALDPLTVDVKERVLKWL
jgi:hypothetical protein